MSFLNSTPDEVAEQAAGIQDQYNRQVSAIKNDPNLSAEGKAKLLAKAYVQTSDTMAELQQTFEAKEAKETEDRNRALFGASSVRGADAVSLRDASDRASKIASGREALAAMQQAELNGDEVLVRAIAAHAHQQSQGPFGALPEWAQVTQAYVSKRPELASKLQQETSGPSAVRKSMGRGAIFMTVKPRELDRLQEHQIRGLAAG